MRRERALKIVLVLVGLLFCAAVHPLILMAKQDPVLAMMISLYATLGVFLLLASRNPSTHRSLIAFTAWSAPSGNRRSNRSFPLLNREYCIAALIRLGEFMSTNRATTTGKIASPHGS